MTSPLANKQIVLGVTGSIACYKAADLASKLTQAGAHVDVILTQAATKFITPLTFQSVTGRKAFVEADLWGQEGHVQHIALGHNADLLVVAPATANTLAKLAHGLADNLLSITALAANCPLLLAPAMDGGMYNHPTTQANLKELQQNGATIIGPAVGHLASGMQGTGRMLEPQEILGHIRLILSHGGPLAGRKIVVSAGGTWEPIDPVRGITNRSTGKQGFALAQAALDYGAEVTLISGPTNLPTPVGVHRVNVTTAEEMLSSVSSAVPETDVLIMAAAVADFRPAKIAVQKLKKETSLPLIELESTSDILSEVAQYKSRHVYPRVTIGFAAESQSLMENARKKLKAKKLDLIVANDITANDAGFGVETNRVILLGAEGGVEKLPLMNKAEVASIVMERVVSLLENKTLPGADPDL